MRKIFDDLTGEEIPQGNVCVIKIERVGGDLAMKSKPFMKPLEVSDITADRIRKQLITESKI